MIERLITVGRESYYMTRVSVPALVAILLLIIMTTIIVGMVPEYSLLILVGCILVFFVSMYLIR